ncbi:MAG: DUF805 domain-containing protein [Sandarakinorhabdus sp.]|nr:DUF805 domain-containing protein [Sandarakinorhabdus sp.]
MAYDASIPVAEIEQPPFNYRSLFWFKGRMQRRRYWLLSLGIASITFSMNAYAAFAPKVTSSLGTTEWISPVLTIGAITTWMSFTALVRRLHDIGMQGWWVLALLPIGFVVGFNGFAINKPVAQAVLAMLVLVIVLLDGTSGPNQFGPDPRGRDPVSADTDPWHRLGRRFDRWTAVGLASIGLIIVSTSLLAERVGRFLPESMTRRFGETALSERVPERYRCRAPDAQVALDRLVRHLDPASHPQILFTSHPNVQGLAVPGNHIVIGQDVLRLAQSPEEIAGLVAHELAHVRLQHPEQLMVMRFALAALPANLARVLDTGWGNSYSREKELQADNLAIQIMNRAGVDPHHLGLLLVRISDERRERRRSNRLDAPSWLSTHPALSERLTNIAKAPPPTSRRTPMSGDDWNAIQRGCVG